MLEPGTRASKGEHNRKNQETPGQQVPQEYSDTGKGAGPEHRQRMHLERLILLLFKLKKEKHI